MSENTRGASLDARSKRLDEGDAVTAADAIPKYQADDVPALQERPGEALLPRIEHLLDLLQRSSEPRRDNKAAAARRLRRSSSRTEIARTGVLRPATGCDAISSARRPQEFLAKIIGDKSGHSCAR